ncbi:phage tail assembly chaperone [Stenotrophomonas sp.]|uniref:phage tail assembly chaperone n=1 Tax=Stenotrophomonas sp. TaxID=69392 RepID=UPI0028AAF140|nr:phage tail assembly chaperone [Stenotrophomonas sp.]
MSDEMYAVSETGYRAVTEEMDLLPGESVLSKVPETVLSAIATKQAKEEVTMRLRRCDWTQATDNDLSEEKRIEWRIYRSNLRDLLGLAILIEIAWPTEPAP